RHSTRLEKVNCRSAGSPAGATRSSQPSSGRLVSESAISRPRRKMHFELARMVFRVCIRFLAPPPQDGWLLAFPNRPYLPCISAVWLQKCNARYGFDRLNTSLHFCSLPTEIQGCVNDPP